MNHDANLAKSAALAGDPRFHYVSMTSLDEGRIIPRDIVRALVLSAIAFSVAGTGAILIIYAGARLAGAV